MICVECAGDHFGFGVTKICAETIFKFSFCSDLDLLILELHHYLLVEGKTSFQNINLLSRSNIE